MWQLACSLLHKYFAIWRRWDLGESMSTLVIVCIWHCVICSKCWFVYWFSNFFKQPYLEKQYYIHSHKWIGEQMIMVLYVCTIEHSLVNTCSNSTHDGQSLTVQHSMEMHMVDGMTVVGGRQGWDSILPLFLMFTTISRSFKGCFPDIYLFHGFSQ